MLLRDLAVKLGGVIVRVDLCHRCSNIPILKGMMVARSSVANFCSACMRYKELDVSETVVGVPMEAPNHSTPASSLYGGSCPIQLFKIVGGNLTI